MMVADKMPYRPIRLIGLNRPILPLSGIIFNTRAVGSGAWRGGW